ncbi:MAG TPA: HEAT repeat domain-containing protein, partial [Planctomycetota bacterium]|nr:HEAT repeat domain-containing protein [Planctomycetota bacterium]
MKLLVFLVFVSLFVTSCSSIDEHLVKLKSPSAVSRCEAILWLYDNIKTETTQKLLMDALYKDENPVVRSLVVRILAIENNPAYIPLLEVALNDASPLVRLEVVQTLGSMHAKQSIPKLLKLLETETDKNVRLKILKTLQYTRSKESIPVLIARLDDPEPAI